MSIRGALLELLEDHGVRASRGVHLAVAELLALLAEANPEREDDPAESEDADADEPGLAVRSVPCPHCGEPVVIELELDGGEQDAIHDCSVCCRPIAFSWCGRDGALERFDAGPA